jgi:hypothetical protein
VTRRRSREVAQFELERRLHSAVRGEFALNHKEQAMFKRVFLMASLALGATAAGCTDEPGTAPPPPDSNVSITLRVGTTERLVVGPVRELVTPYVHDRGAAFQVDGADTYDPGRLVTATSATVNGDDGQPIDFEATGGRLVTTNLATPVSIVWSESGDGVTLTTGAHVISLELDGVADHELVERWLGGVAIDLLQNREPGFMVEGQGWMFLARLAKLNSRTLIRAGAIILGLSVSYTVVLGQINIRQCRTLVINACRTQARAECNADGLVIKSVQGKCTADVFGSVDASCDFECQPRPAAAPANPNPAPANPAPGNQKRAAGDDEAGEPTAIAAAFGAVATDTTVVVAPEPPPAPGCEYETWTYDDDGNVVSHSSGATGCPAAADGSNQCSFTLCHNEYGDLQCQSAVGDCDTFDFAE